MSDNFDNLDHLDKPVTEQDLLTEKLALFGLSPAESRMYLFLQGGEPSTILEVSRGLNIPRTSVYDNAQKLIEKGLVERVIKHKSTRLKAHPLEILQSLIDERKTTTDHMEKNLEYLQKQFSHVLMPHASTQVRYYEGVSGFRQMMSNALQATYETIGYSVFGRVEIVGHKFYERWVEEFKARQLRDRVITTQLPETLHYIEQDVQPGQHQCTLNSIKYLPSRYLYLSGDTTIYNNIFSVSYWKEGEVVGIEIENENLVKTQKTIFELMWAQARPIKELLDPSEERV